MLLYINKKKNYSIDKKTALLYKAACAMKDIHRTLTIAKDYATRKNITTKEAMQILKDFKI